MLGWQAEGAAPLVPGSRSEPETVASAIRIGNPASWHLAVEAARRVRRPVPRRQRRADPRRPAAARRAPRASSSSPASAASVAGLLQDVASGRGLPRRDVVVTVTGHGLKDIDTALSTFTDLVDTVVDADVTPRPPRPPAGLGDRR